MLFKVENWKFSRVISYVFVNREHKLHGMPGHADQTIAA